MDEDFAERLIGIMKRMLSSILGRHTYTILLAEPDQNLRRLERRTLSCRYHIIPTSSAEEAVRVAARREKKIDLLLSEVHLQHMAGWELADLLKLDYPNLKVVYLSSSLDPQIRPRMRPSIVVLLDDPFRPNLLRKAVHDVLEARPNDERPNLDRRVPKPFTKRVV